MATPPQSGETLLWNGLVLAGLDSFCFSLGSSGGAALALCPETLIYGSQMTGLMLVTADYPGKVCRCYALMVRGESRWQLGDTTSGAGSFDQGEAVELIGRQ